MVVESIIFAMLLLGAIYYVVTIEDSTSDAAPLRSDLTRAADDAITILSGLRACAQYDDPSPELDACAEVYGSRELVRVVSEALTGEPRNLSNRMKTFLPPGAQWNFHLDNGLAPQAVVALHEAEGERATASRHVVPQWNLTFVETTLSHYNWSAAGENDIVVYAMPTWKSHVVEPAGAFNVEFMNGHAVDLSSLVVDGERGNLSTIAGWKLNEGTNTRAYDLRDRMTLTLDPARWVSGRSGTALDFRPGDAALVGYDPAGSHTLVREASLFAWVHPDSFPVATDARLFRIEAGTGPSVEIRISTTGEPYARVSDALGTTYDAVDDEPLPLASWSHVAAAYGDEVLTLFVDGVEQASTSAPAGQLDVAAPARILLGGRSIGDSEDFDGRIDEPRAYSFDVGEDAFSSLRYGSVAPARTGAPGWQPTPGVRRVIESEGAYNSAPLKGRANYRVLAGESAIATHAPALERGLEDARIAAYANATGTRYVELGKEVAIEFDFRPLLARLKADGVTLWPGAVTYSTVSVRAPVVSPPGTAPAFMEVANETTASAHGYLNFTIPTSAILGSHFVVASLNVTMDGGGHALGELARKVDYFDVVLPNETTPPLDPTYRAVIEIWVPEWRS